MSGLDDLGEQTVTVIEQKRGQHNIRYDGARRAHNGCSVQPRLTAEGSDHGGREQDTAQWALYAPPEFTATAADVVIAEPGPVGDDGAPLRLELYGTPQTWWDDDGAALYVAAVLRRITG